MRRKKTKHASALLLLMALSLGLVIFYIAGCVVVPDNALVVSGSKDREVQRSAAACGPVSDLGGSDQAMAGINPEDFSILSWNSHRGSDKAWGRELVSVGGEADIILLQEAALESMLDNQLELFANEWLMATAFHYDEKEIGIFSAARVPAQTYCATREQEPLIRIPKIALAVTYPLAGLQTRLLVVNIHLVNFTITTDAMQHQIDALQDIIRNHQGPVVVAGDFNTWNSDRETLVTQKMADLGLQAVVFQPDNRVKFFNHKVDNVFYRGLLVKKSSSHRVSSSDHNPLEVHFTLAEPPRSM
jgi:endonuclease/exonuclease/phosphatase (EEP) superfamily protein YafD